VEEIRNAHKNLVRRVFGKLSLGKYTEEQHEDVSWGLGL
jgi:hypothetical protein